MKCKHGIIGFPLGHTLSPAMHNASFEKFKLDSEYLVFETRPEQVGEFIDKMRKEGIKGINVTIPHKHTVMKYLDKIDKAARTIGAVNTIVNNKGKLTGYNTDYLGFLKTLELNKIKLKGKEVVMIGAGGAAHALAYAIKLLTPKKFHIINIDMAMSETLLKKLKLKNIKLHNLDKTAEKDAIIAKADFIINATSVGMHDHEVPYKIDKLKKSAVVYDLIYNPAKTEFLKQAEKKGVKIINGLDMLIWQGIEAFKIWTGKTPDYKFVKKAVDAYLKKNKK